MQQGFSKSVHEAKAVLVYVIAIFCLAVVIAGLVAVLLS